MPFLRRLAFAPLVLVAVAFVTYGVPRVLRADKFPGEQFVSGVTSDVNRALLHFGFGGLVIGAASGVAAGSWCSRRPRALRSRLVEWAAMVAFRSPIFFTGLFIL